MILNTIPINQSLTVLETMSYPTILLILSSRTLGMSLIIDKISEKSLKIDIA